MNYLLVNWLLKELNLITGQIYVIEENGEGPALFLNFQKYLHSSAVIVGLQFFLRICFVPGVR